MIFKIFAKKVTRKKQEGNVIDWPGKTQISVQFYKIFKTLTIEKQDGYVDSNR